METITNPTNIPNFPKPYQNWKFLLYSLQPNQYVKVSGEWKDNTLRQACRRASIEGRRYRMHKEGTEVQLWRLQ